MHGQQNIKKVCKVYHFYTAALEPALTNSCGPSHESGHPWFILDVGVVWQLKGRANTRMYLARNQTCPHVPTFYPKGRDTYGKTFCWIFVVTNFWNWSSGSSLKLCEQQSVSDNLRMYVYDWCKSRPPKLFLHRSSVTQGDRTGICYGWATRGPWDWTAERRTCRQLVCTCTAVVWKTDTVGRS